MAILVDAGPLIAAADPSDPKSRAVREAIDRNAGALVSADGCLAEALHILHRDLGWAGQERLLKIATAIGLQLYSVGEGMARIAELMARYRNVPMDFPDACLVYLSESLGIHRVLTLDSDFAIYRSGGGRAFDME